MLEHYLSLLIKSIFIENMALAFFLGMCTFLAVSKQVRTTLGLCAAVIVVETNPEPGVPAYDSWWDVPVAEVSVSERVREARTQYEEDLRRERIRLEQQEKKLVKEIDELESQKSNWERYGHDGLELLDETRVAQEIETKNYVGALLDHRGGHIHPLNLALGEAVKSGDRTLLDEIIGKLKAQGTDDANFFAGQLETALEVFAR